MRTKKKKKPVLGWFKGRWFCCVGSFTAEGVIHYIKYVALTLALTPKPSRRYTETNTIRSHLGRHPGLAEIYRTCIPGLKLEIRGSFHNGSGKYVSLHALKYVLVLDSAFVRGTFIIIATWCLLEYMLVFSTRYQVQYSCMYYTRNHRYHIFLHILSICWS